LIQKDIPDLIKATGLDIQAAVLKGRSNYLCPRRFNAMRRRKPETLEELRVMGKVLVWLQSSQSGDRSELNLNGMPERLFGAASQLRTRAVSSKTASSTPAGAAPSTRRAFAAESAHILVVNHACSWQMPPPKTAFCLPTTTSSSMRRITSNLPPPTPWHTVCVLRMSTAWCVTSAAMNRACWGGCFLLPTPC
jgi:hypothetical protein